VLTGIATALAGEARRATDGPVGLGTGGAIAINAFGGGAVASWMATGARTSIPLRGRLMLGAVATAVLGIGAMEAWGEASKRANGARPVVNRRGSSGPG
jgi:hypothetical protein